MSAKGKIPEKACGSIEFVVSTYAVIEGEDYPIDYAVFDSAYDLPLMQKSQFGLLIDYQKEKVRMKAVEMGAVLQDFKSLIC